MTPKLDVKSVRMVYGDGNHNAFTDLIRYRGRFFLTFRGCPDGHSVFPTSHVIVLRSDDAEAWEEVCRFSVPNRDVRDPHFLDFKGRLFVYTGTWFCPLKEDFLTTPNEHLGYAVWTEDGESWSEPRLLEGTYGHYIWRAAAFGDKAYLCARRYVRHQRPQELGNVKPPVEAALLESDDGLIWRWRCFLQEREGNEVAFLFEEDGSIMALGRRSGPAEIFRSRPPYTDWTRTDLDRSVGGPMLVKREERYLAGGRRTTGGTGPITALYWIVNDRLVEIATVPSGGDNSYPGFVALDDRRGLLSYYSSHEGSGGTEAPAHIYLAEIVIAD